VHLVKHVYLLAATWQARVSNGAIGFQHGHEAAYSEPGYILTSPSRAVAPHPARCATSPSTRPDVARRVAPRRARALRCRSVTSNENTSKGLAT
jgi:hypothetical protein